MKEKELENLVDEIRNKLKEMNDFLPKRKAVWQELQKLHLDATGLGLQFEFHFPVSCSRIGDEISIGRITKTVIY